MQTVNINCTHCSKLMGVSIELLGRNVRCPHCKQVVQAPTSAKPAPAAKAGPDDSARPNPPTGPTPFEPTLQMPTAPQESTESIFGEVHDDDLFGTKRPAVQLPEEIPAPAPMRSGSTTPSPTAPHFSVSNEISPPSEDNLTLPWNRSEGLREANPDSNASQQPSRSPAQPEAPSGPMSSVFIIILLLYGALASGAAAYLFFTRSSQDGASAKNESTNPFAAIPDLYGQYPPAERKKLVRLPGMPATNDPLPASSMVAMANTLAVGNLEITPKKIEFGSVLRYDIKAGETVPEKRALPRELFVLQLHIRNTSNDVSLHPTDPAFNALYSSRLSPPILPYTGIFIEDEHFLGGPFYWPDPQYERQYVAGQDKDSIPLAPGEHRDYYIASNINTNKITDLLQLKKKSAIWRVQLRTGLTTAVDSTGQSHEISTTSVIGIPFAWSDIQSSK